MSARTPDEASVAALGQKGFLSRLPPDRHPGPMLVSGFGHDAAVIEVPDAPFDLVHATGRASYPARHAARTVGTPDVGPDGGHRQPRRHPGPRRGPRAGVVVNEHLRDRTEDAAGFLDHVARESFLHERGGG